MTLAVAHAEGEKVVVNCVREVVPKFLAGRRHIRDHNKKGVLAVRENASIVLSFLRDR